MTKDEIIRMAREAGISDTYFDFQMVSPEDLSRFAALVAAAEREACAKAIEDSMDEFPNNTDWSDGYIHAAKDIADGVRARGCVLQAKVEEMGRQGPSVPDDVRKDAERYRFLEHLCATGSYGGIISRKAIDAAMLAATPEAKP